MLFVRGLGEFGEVVLICQPDLLHMQVSKGAMSWTGKNNVTQAFLQ